MVRRSMSGNAPEHMESSVADAMRRSVVTHHRRRIKDLSFNDRSNLAGQVAGYRTLFLKYRGATILGRLRTSRFLNESVYARASEIANKRPRFLRGQFDKGE